ncbi:GNAT family N-acetyltransferase [Patescibacteria group bacterium]
MDIELKNVEKDESEFYFLIRKATIKSIIEQYKPWDEEKEKKEIPKKINYERDKIVFYKNKKIGLISWSEKNNIIHLGLLNILPEYQSLGIGSKLLNDLIQKGKEIHLDTYENNDRAISFYKKHGFEITGHNREGTCPKVLMKRPKTA